MIEKFMLTANSIKKKRKVVDINKYAYNKLYRYNIIIINKNK